jgi:ferrous iron transport protein A
VLAPQTLAGLKKGQTARIGSFTDKELSLRLLELGLLPGAEVTLCYSAPLGCPLCVQVQGCRFSLRREEAATILVD